MAIRIAQKFARHQNRSGFSGSDDCSALNWRRNQPTGTIMISVA